MTRRSQLCLSFCSHLLFKKFTGSQPRCLLIPWWARTRAPSAWWPKPRTTSLRSRSTVRLTPGLLAAAATRPALGPRCSVGRRQQRRLGSFLLTFDSGGVAPVPLADISPSMRCPAPTEAVQRQADMGPGREAAAGEGEPQREKGHASRWGAAGPHRKGAACCACRWRRRGPVGQGGRLGALPACQPCGHMLCAAQAYTAAVARLPGRTNTACRLPAAAERGGEREAGDAGHARHVGEALLSWQPPRNSRTAGGLTAEARMPGQQPPAAIRRTSAEECALGAW